MENVALLLQPLARATATVDLDNDVWEGGAGKTVRVLVIAHRARPADEISVL